MQVETEQKKGRFKAVLVAAIGAYFLYQFMQTGGIDWLIMAIGSAMILPKALLHPGNWRSPERLDSKPHVALRLLSFGGVLCIVIGLLMEWL